MPLRRVWLELVPFNKGVGPAFVFCSSEFDVWGGGLLALSGEISPCFLNYGSEPCAVEKPKRFRVPHRKMVTWNPCHQSPSIRLWRVKVAHSTSLDTCTSKSRSRGVNKIALHLQNRDKRPTVYKKKRFARRRDFFSRSFSPTTHTQVTRLEASLASSTAREDGLRRELADTARREGANLQSHATALAEVGAERERSKRAAFFDFQRSLKMVVLVLTSLHSLDWNETPTYVRAGKEEGRGSGKRALSSHLEDRRGETNCLLIATKIVPDRRDCFFSYKCRTLSSYFCFRHGYRYVLELPRNSPGAIEASEDQATCTVALTFRRFGRHRV